VFAFLTHAISIFVCGLIDGAPTLFWSYGAETGKMIFANLKSYKL
jgi:hypothetical protein